MTKTITKILKSTATIISSVVATFSCVIVLLKLLEIWLEFYLFALLETEVRLSTGCSLKAGKWDINIFSLTGHASNTRVECAGQLKILTNLMKGEFSLKNIPRGIIDLKLIVEGGWSDGFWEESSLYKLIDFLALEPSKPPIVRLRLNRLDVFSYKTSGEFLGVNIKTEDAKINYLRKKDDFLALKIQFSHMNANELVFRDGELIFDLNDIVALRSGQTQIDNLTVKAYGLFNHRDEINLELKDEIGTSTISVIKDETEFSQRERSKIKEQSTIRVKSFGSTIEIGQFALKNHQVDLTLSEFEDNLLKSEKNLYFVFLLFHALLSTAKGSIKIGTLFGNDSIKINDLEILLKEKEAEISIGGIHLGQVKVPSLQLIASIEGGNLILDVSKPFKGLIRFETNTKTITSENLLFHSIKLSNIRFVIKENDIIGQLSALGHNFEFNLGDQLRVRNDLKSFDLVFDKNLNANFNDFSISLACFNLRISGQLIDYPKLSLRIDLLKVFINCNNLNEVIELRDVAIPLDAFKIHTVLTSNFGKFNFGAKGKPTAFLIHLTGETNLNFFVRDLMPGLITSIPTKLDFEAVFDNFKLVDLRGFFNIKDGFAYHANGLLRVDKFSGNAQIIPSGINIEIFNGTVNEGFLNFTGQINFDGSYNISGQFKNVSFKWQDMLQSKLTGDFRFAHNERIKINLGIEEGSISIPEDSVIDSIIQRTKSEKFQDILKIVSDFNAELNVETLNPISLTSAKITTQLWGRANMIYGKQPSITGEINMLGGNLTISSNIFDIKRGLVRFSETGTPSIEILASRLFFYSKNFPVEVNANIYGDLFSPTVELYSVPSLEQEEIQKIVFARDPAFFNLNPRGVTIFKDSNTPLNLISKTFLKEFFPSAVSFDVKPVEGERTAYVLHIGKDLLPNLKLLGESAFFDNYSVNSVKLNFSVLDHLSLIGEISNNPLLPRTGFSFDILYSVFESGGDAIFKFKGNAQLSSEKLMAALPTLKFAPTQVLDSLAKALVREYIKNGYLNAKVKVTCKEIFESYCKKIEFYIDEGDQNLISEIITQSDLTLPDFIGKPLTEETLVNIVKKYQISLLEKNFLVSDIHIETTCNHNNTHNNCSIKIAHERSIPIAIKFQVDPESKERFKEFLILIGSQITYLDHISKFLDEFAKIEATRTGKFPKIDIQKIEDQLNLVVKSADWHVNVQFIDLPEACEVTDTFAGKTLEQILGIIQSDISPCKLKVTRYELTWSNDSSSVLTVFLSKSSPIELLIENKEQSLKIRTVLQDETNPLEHAKRVLLDHGYFVRSGRLIENTPGYIFSVDDVQILSIKEIKLLNLQGVDIPQNLLNKLQSFINARASRETILEIVKKIERTQIFKVIEYNFDQKSGELKIVLSYEPKNSLKFGLGYHSELGIHLSTFFSNQIFFEQGETLFGKLDLFFKEDLSFVQSGSASVSYIDPLVDFDNFQIESFGIYQRTKQSDLPFNFERYTASIGLNRVGTYSVKPTIGLTQDLVFDVASDLYSSDTNIFSPFIGLEFRKENIDNYAFPTSGYSFRAQLKLGTADVNYAEIKSSLTKFLSLSKNLVFDLSLKYQEIMSNKEVPLPYRYFVGGRDSLRGYKLFKLGEKGDQGSPLGGTRFVGSQVELNWIFYDPLALVVFTDFGGIDNLERDELGIGSGLGVRYLSPVGPVGLEVARGIYKNDSRRDLAFYFNLGISF